LKLRSLNAWRSYYYVPTCVFSNESLPFHSLPSTVLQPFWALAYLRRRPHSSLPSARFFHSLIPRISAVSLRTTSFLLFLGFPTGLVTYILNGSKYCPTILEIVVLRVPNRNFWDFSLCNVDFKIRNCPAIRVSVLNATDIDTYIINIFSFNDWLVSDTLTR
jgi:hypothetical protein